MHVTIASGNLARRRCEGPETRLDQVVQKVYSSRPELLTSMLHNAMPAKAPATETARSRELPQREARVVWQGDVQLSLCLRKLKTLGDIRAIEPSGQRTSECHVGRGWQLPECPPGRVVLVGREEELGLG